MGQFPGLLTMLYSGVHLVYINFVDTLKVISNIQFWHAKKKHNITKHLIKLWGDYLELKTACFKQVSGQTNKLPPIFFAGGRGVMESHLLIRVNSKCKFYCLSKYCLLLLFVGGNWWNRRTKDIHHLWAYNFGNARQLTLSRFSMPSWQVGKHVRNYSICLKI